jgi:hypothetical protein
VSTDAQSTDRLDFACPCVCSATASRRLSFTGGEWHDDGPTEVFTGRSERRLATNTCPPPTPPKTEVFYVPGGLDYDADGLNWGGANRKSMLYTFTVFTTIGYGCVVRVSDC